MTGPRTFYVDDELVSFIDQVAARYGISRSMALRRMVVFYQAAPGFRLFGCT